MTGTLKMPKAMKQAWVDALRSGKYKQGYGRMCTVLGNGGKSFCCLGVLQQAVDGDVEWADGEYAKYVKLTAPTGQIAHSVPMPSPLWLEGHHVDFVTNDGQSFGGGLPVQHPFWTLSQMNDFKHFNFRQIADWIDENVEGVE